MGLLLTTMLNIYSVCPGGKYGHECTGECGFCQDGKPCDHVSGICTNGCKDGWSGDKCKNSK